MDMDNGGSMALKVIPAIDLLDGKCVRLVKGEYGTASAVADNAVETARMFERCGAEYLHMVDLDGAKNGAGSAKNREIIREIVADCGMFVEVGGGIRTIDDIEYVLSLGVSRVILGSAATDDSLLSKAVMQYGDKIAVGIDAKNGFVALSGWIEETKLYYLDFAKHVEDIGVSTIIFTDISTDGTLSGPNYDMLTELQKKVGLKIIASGGIKDIEDIKKLATMKIYGAICGKSIYAGTLDLKESIYVVKKNYTMS